ncbi:70-kilodalton heat shock protein [Linnemannia hyalina]|uniref:70-kilodalton heat shock protein n=1 Tax=Linnemannia hyalina TaxID=64524 RepID=A0A9P8BTX9_9FUNG|nr:70-kilodalton heat shock protein [Linnemannia hyalina]
MTREQDEKVGIGIDLGTAFSKVAIWNQNHVEVISNGKDIHATPSLIAFSETGLLFGQEAQDRVSRYPLNTIFDIKRLIGRQFDDKDVQSDIERWPFKVIGKGNKPYYRVAYKDGMKELSPEEVTAMVIAELHRTAEAHLGTIVTDAVISVPSKFSHAQRQAVVNAGTIAGLNILNVISQASAAALALAVDRATTTDEKNILIIDLGAGTLEVTLFYFELDIIDVVATAGNTHLGGRDFDNRLVDDLVQEFKCRSGRDISSDTRALARLRTICERTKRTLSDFTEATIDIGYLTADIDFSTTMTRARFETLNQDLFESILEPIAQVLRDSKRRGEVSVDEIILVGGSSRIPKVQQLVSDFFGGKELITTFHTDDAVAHGTAIYAAILTGSFAPKLQNIILLNVVSHSIGVGDGGGVMTAVIKRNYTIPTKITHTVCTEEDNQTRLLVPVYEGEGSRVKDNTMIGMLEITGLPPAPRGVAQVAVDFDIDIRGTVGVNKSRVKNNNPMITVTGHIYQLSKDEMGRMVQAFESYKSVDERDVADFRKMRTSFD